MKSRGIKDTNDLVLLKLMANSRSSLHLIHQQLWPCWSVPSPRKTFFTSFQEITFSSFECFFSLLHLQLLCWFPLGSISFLSFFFSLPLFYLHTDSLSDFMLSNDFKYHLTLPNTTFLSPGKTFKLNSRFIKLTAYSCPNRHLQLNMSELMAEFSSKTLLLPQSSLNQAMAITSFQLGAILDSLTPPFPLACPSIQSVTKYGGLYFENLLRNPFLTSSAVSTHPNHHLSFGN